MKALPPPALTEFVILPEVMARGNLRVDENEILGDRPDDPKGVYARGVRHNHERDD